MSDRAPWFKCFPSLLLGALSAMSPEEGYTYTVLLMRLYEADGPVSETPRTMARRTGLTERKVSEAIEGLIAMGKVQRLPDGRLDSDTTHDEIADRSDRRDAASGAGKASARKRAEKTRNKIAREHGAEKTKQNQQTAATHVQRGANELQIELHTPSETTSLREPRAERASDNPEKKSPAKRAHRLPADWWPDEDLKAFARERLPSNRACQEETDKFKDWAASAKNAVKVDWSGTYRNWIRKAAESYGGQDSFPRDGFAGAMRSGPTGSRDAPRRQSANDRLVEGLWTVMEHLPDDA